jgi:hypothetical protein
MTYDESQKLMTDTAFRGRVKVACLRFADAIMNEASTEPEHNTRMKWAQQAMVERPSQSFAQPFFDAAMTTRSRAWPASLLENFTTSEILF